MYRIRRLFQIGILVAALATGFRYAMGWTRITIETFCPFGGLEGLLALLTDRQFTCATGERNLMLFIALVVLTLVSRRVFCSWVCPVGTISEGVLWLSRKMGFGKEKNRAPSGLLIPRKWDNRLRWLRIPILAAILFLTYKTGELIFRSVDPYYILFSFHGHDVFWWSYIFIAFVIVSIVLIPMAWCRYLCPLGGALWPLSRFGLLRMTRSDACISCGKCDAACPQGLTISTVDSVTTGECTLCLECRRICPVEGTLEIRTPGGF